MPARDLCRRSGVSLALLFSILLGGCANYGAQTASQGELGGLKGGSQAAVMIHFVAKDQDGKSLQPFVSGIEETNLAFFLGDAESAGAPTNTIMPGYISGGIGHWKYLGRFLSKEARNDGWITLFLPPGYYYLVVTTAMQNTVYADWPPRWRIEVPAGAPVIYAGTFLISAEATIWTWPEWGKLDQAATRISDESPLARTVASRDLPALPPPVTRLVQEQSGPYRFGIPPAAAD